MTRRTEYLALPLAAALLSGCEALAGLGGGMAMVSGDDQPGRAGQPLGKPFVVRVTDGGGVAIPNVVVTWVVTSGHGVLDGRWQACSPPYEGESDDPAPTVSAITDGGGFARVSFMPTWFRPTSVAARSPGIPGSPVTFTTDATDPGARIEIVWGAEQDGVWTPGRWTAVRSPAISSWFGSRTATAEASCMFRSRGR